LKKLGRQIYKFNEIKRIQKTELSEKKISALMRIHSLEKLETGIQE
jgi:hypothetical protein